MGDPRGTEQARLGVEGCCAVTLIITILAMQPRIPLTTPLQVMSSIPENLEEIFRVSLVGDRSWIDYVKSMHPFYPGVTMPFEQCTGLVSLVIPVPDGC